jgi:hypothetical protein
LPEFIKSGIFVFVSIKKTIYKLDNGQKDRFTLNVADNNTLIEPYKPYKKKGLDKTFGWYYLGKFSEIGFAIAMPIVIGAVIGSAIDRKWFIYPKATLTGLLIGVVISIFTFIKTIQMLLQENQ